MSQCREHVGSRECRSAGSTWVLGNAEGRRCEGGRSYSAPWSPSGKPPKSAAVGLHRPRGADQRPRPSSTVYYHLPFQLGRYKSPARGGVNGPVGAHPGAGRVLPLLLDLLLSVHASFYVPVFRNRGVVAGGSRAGGCLGGVLRPFYGLVERLASPFHVLVQTGHDLRRGLGALLRGWRTAAAARAGVTATAAAADREPEAQAAKATPAAAFFE
jgi:hypothetical protein